MFNPETCIIRAVCPCCGDLLHIHALVSQFEAWQAGALIQDAFPDMDATDRETLISGLCPDCQATFFAEEDEELEDFALDTREQFNAEWGGE